jgi:hypothetical protein
MVLPYDHESYALTLTQIVNISLHFMIMNQILLVDKQFAHPSNSIDDVKHIKLSNILAETNI